MSEKKRSSWLMPEWVWGPSGLVPYIPPEKIKQEQISKERAARERAALERPAVRPPSGGFELTRERMRER